MGVRKMPNHSVAAIANEFLKKARDEGRALTHMQLQKLPYIAHGWGSAILNQPLLSVTPQAWRYGPVYPTLYDALSRYGAGAVDDFVRENDGNCFARDRGKVVEAHLTDHEKKLINMVWNKYKTKGGIDLSAITHEQGTPWTKTVSKFGLQSQIPESLIKEHYDDLLRKNLQAMQK